MFKSNKTQVFGNALQKWGYLQQKTCIRIIDHEFYNKNIFTLQTDQQLFFFKLMFTIPFLV